MESKAVRKRLKENAKYMEPVKGVEEMKEKIKARKLMDVKEVPFHPEEVKPVNVHVEKPKVPLSKLEHIKGAGLLATLAISLGGALGGAIAYRYANQ